MVPKSPRILVVAEQAPSHVHGINMLLARPDYRFVVSRIEDATGLIQEEEPTAAVILGTSHCFNGHQKELIKVLDALCMKHIGAVMMTFNQEDFEFATRLATADGLMVVPHTCSTDELLGRLTGIMSVKALVDQLAQENAMLRKFDSGLNSQMSQIDEEMRLAARLQTDFLPRRLPDLNGCGFDVLFRPASYVSGDIYDAVRLDEHHVGFYIADAVGHGMPAALLTIFIKRTLKTKEITETGYRLVLPDEAMANLNEEMLSQQLSHCQFATMAYCIVNTETMEMQFSRAGHPLPLLLKADGRVEELASEGALLGVFPGETFPLTTVKLEPGDRVLLFSDGFESAYHDPSGIANERYREVFAKLACRDGRKRFSEMVEGLDAQEGSLHPRDDVTALMFSGRD